MPLIGVRELRTKTAEVLRSIREEGTEYIVTHQGRPVAMLLPLDEEALEAAILRAGRQARSSSWEEYEALAGTIRAAWPAKVRSADIVRDIRR